MYRVLEPHGCSWPGSTDKSPETGIQGSVWAVSCFYLFSGLRPYSSPCQQSSSTFTVVPAHCTRSSWGSNKLRPAGELCKLEKSIFQSVVPEHLLKMHSHFPPHIRNCRDGAQHSVQQALQGTLMPATVLGPLLSSYNITSLPKGFLIPLLPLLGMYDSSGLSVIELIVPVCLGFSQFYHKISYYPNPFVSDQSR